MKRKIGIIASTILCFAACISGYFFSQPIHTAKAFIGEFESIVEIKEIYDLGTSFTMPTGKIKYGSKSVDVDKAYLINPMGDIYDGASYILDVLGEYTLYYTAEEGLNSYTAEKQFTVVQNNYTVTSDKSSTEYIEKLQRPLKSDDDALTIPGLKVNLAEGDVFHYNQEIITGNVDEPFITFFPYGTEKLNVKTEKWPNGAYAIDFAANKVIVRLTDCYDESNYIELVFHSKVSNVPEGPYGKVVEIKASANGGTIAAMGVDNPNNSNFAVHYVDGVPYNFYYGDSDWGPTLIWGGNRALKQISLYYDAETKKVYFDNEETKSLINDLDNTDINDEAFKGFKTNEVKLSVYAEQYSKATMGVEIVSIGNYKGEDLEKSAYMDKNAPIINVDTKYDTKKQYKAAVGEEISIFDATARDINLIGDVKARVFYSYGMPNATQVYVEDGKFTPAQEGEYSIVYTAQDSYGNVRNEVVTFIVLNAEYNDDKSLHLKTEKLSQIRIGEWNTLPDYTLTSINNENVELKIYAVYKADDTYKVEIDKNTRKFFVENVGEYEIVYEYEGAVRKYTYKYTVDGISCGNVYIDVENIYLPAYFIKNAAYTLEEIKAFEYTETKPQSVNCTYYVSEDGGDWKQINYADYTVGANVKLKFKYVCGNQEYVSQEIPVVDVGFGVDLDIEKYFTGNDFIKTSSAMVKLTATSGLKTAQTDFVNVLSFNTFGIKFSTIKEMTNYQALEYALTDYYNPEKKVTISFFNNDGKMAFSVNDGKPLALVNPFDGSGRVTLSYNSATNKFELGNDVSAVCPVQFTSDKVMFSLKMIGIEGEASLDLYELNGQVLKNVSSDAGYPSLIVNDIERGERSLNEVITITPATYGDVLSPYLQKNTNLKVLTPNGSCAKALDGTLLDGTCDATKTYQIKLEEYGIYNVMFGYKDQYKKESKLGYVMYVSDREKPVIKIGNGYNENTVLTKKLNSSITIADFTATDNFGEAALVKYVMVFSPHNGMNPYTSGEKLVLTHKGEWKICYYCMDEQGNLGMTYYTVLVK